MTIRPMRPEEVERIVEITLASFEPVSIDRNIEREYGLIAGTDWRARKARDVRRDCEVLPQGVFVAEIEGAIVGYISTRLDPATRVGHIPNLAVDPDTRGQGIGTALIKHAMAWLREQGMVLARIETLEQNARGQALYPRFGFREVARQIHYAAPLDE